MDWAHINYSGHTGFLYTWIKPKVYRSRRFLYAWIKPQADVHWFSRHKAVTLPTGHKWRCQLSFPFESWHKFCIALHSLWQELVRLRRHWRAVCNSGFSFAVLLLLFRQFLLVFLRQTCEESIENNVMKTINDETMTDMREWGGGGGYCAF